MKRVTSLNPRIVSLGSVPICAFPLSFTLNRFLKLHSFNEYCSHSRNDNGGVFAWLMITPRKS